MVSEVTTVVTELKHYSPIAIELIVICNFVHFSLIVIKLLNYDVTSSFMYRVS